MWCLSLQRVRKGKGGKGKGKGKEKEKEKQKEKENGGAQTRRERDYHGFYCIEESFLEKFPYAIAGVEAAQTMTDKGNSPFLFLVLFDLLQGHKLKHLFTQIKMFLRKKEKRNTHKRRHTSLAILSPPTSTPS